jgi:hypothetical protein
VMEIFLPSFCPLPLRTRASPLAVPHRIRVAIQLQYSSRAGLSRHEHAAPLYGSAMLSSAFIGALPVFSIGGRDQAVKAAPVMCDAKFSRRAYCVGLVPLTNLVIIRSLMELSLSTQCPHYVCFQMPSTLEASDGEFSKAARLVSFACRRLWLIVQLAAPFWRCILRIENSRVPSCFDWHGMAHITAIQATCHDACATGMSAD